MARVLGENFDRYVLEQINTRQSVLGDTERSAQNILVFNSNKPWLRMASSVNVSQTKARELGLGTLTEGALAREFILGGGVINDTGQPTSGIVSDFSTDKRDSLRVSYGNTFNNNFGLTPPPGLTSISVTALNNGALRKATVKVTCFTPDQFQIIDALYLRIGMTVLVEWGHSTYFDNKGLYTTKKEFSTGAFDGFIEGTVDQFSILKLIEKDRVNAAGNYDGMFGKITNYQYSYNQGIYEISIDIYSMGDVMESLKVNTAINIDIQSANTSGSVTDSPLLISDKDASRLNSHLFYWKSELDKLPLTKVESSGGEFAYIDQTPGSVVENLKTDKELVKIQYITRDVENKRQKNAEYYVKLGPLLRFINNELLLYNRDTSKPLIRVYDPQDYNNSLMFTLREQFSSDPTICIVPFYDRPNNRSRLEQITGTQFRATELAGIYSARIQHIHINLNFIAKILKDSADKEGKVSLYTLLNKLVASINKSLGSINTLEVSYDADENIALIIDKTRIPGYKSVNNPVQAVFAINGVNTAGGFGSFVRNLTFQSQLTKDLSTMMATSAQAGGNVTGEDGTFFATINKGLTDRIVPEKVDAIDAKGKKTSSTEQSPEDKFSGYTDSLKGSLNAIYNLLKINKGTLEVLQSIQKDYLKYIRGNSTKQGSIEAQGFIPMNMGLEIHGLGGIKLFQQFSVTQEILPPYYTGQLSFIVKGINHSVDNDKWTTTLETLAIASEKGQKSPAEELKEQLVVKKKEREQGEGNNNAIRANENLKTIFANAGYPEGTPEFEIGVAIGTKEGWNGQANGGVGTRSFRNNNPGNLDYDSGLKDIDPGVKLENNPYGSNRFAHFTTAELGAKALVEKKVRKWARGNMPITAGNTKLIKDKNGGNQYKKGTKPTIAQFFYTYAPPNENNTEGYITSVVSTLKTKLPEKNVSRNSILNDLLA
jgi:hypothetical protein